MSQPDDITQRTVKTMATVFGVAEPTLTPDASPETIEAWDSHGHMNLVLALESAFDVEFDEDQIAQMNTVELVVLSVREALDG